MTTQIRPMTNSFPILLIDDEPDIASVIQRVAQRDFPEAHFHHVSHPNDVLPYLDAATTDAPKLVLLDVDLGTSQTGIDLIAQLRSHPLGHIVPIVMLSANQKKETVMDSYQRGANAFTHKPYSYGEWKEYVQALRIYWYKYVVTPIADE